MNQAAVRLLAQTFPHGLLHPGDDVTPSRVVPVPGFRVTGMAPEQAEELVGESAKVFAEALVHLLESDFEIVPRGEMQQLRLDAAEVPDGVRTVQVHCHCDVQRRDPLFELTVDKSDVVVVNGPGIVAGLARREAQCPHKVKQ
ncbi:hypothetical protein HWD06_gp095 [Mycobacterium phage Cornie]|uniref:Uncharacterized protein n=1 Tax=Mycobacterium phage Cornie TaxID=2704043 RepID=A0A6G6XL27_9CAUD|nr:hypothetical protein HWD06_gp095 [Mycobacterium phage Cornie]QIG58470.1 hypothetical protein SEA_CORNIE_95 [Mycobacterium phage Cornie]